MRRLVVAVVLAASLAPAVALAQDSTTRCNAINTDSTRQHSVKTYSGQYNSFFGAGVVVVCPAKKIHLRADSAEQYSDQKRFYLVGHVFYREPRFTLHSDFLNYYMAEERVVATGHVRATMPSGSRLRGPEATYLRPIPKTRPLAIVTATGRPTITLIQRDSLGHPSPPTDVTANHVYMQGDSLVYAGGAVQIARNDFTAHSDSLYLDGRHDVLHLIGHPVIRGAQGRHPFTLVGTLIDLFSHEQKLRRVLAKGKGLATSKDLRLVADTIDLRVENDLLHEAMAWGPGGASAKAPTDSLIADSLDVIMPHQQVREIHAIGNAYAARKPDSVKFHTKDMDWLQGDTILATFDSVPPKDTAQSPRLRRLVAIDSARAYYHLAPQDTTLCVPAVSYSTGQRITVAFGAKGVERVDVIGKTLGVLAEPDTSTRAQCAKPKAAKSDTTGKSAKPDTTGKSAKPDSTRKPAVRPDTSSILRALRR